jgi:hypothetical protein
MCWLEANKTKLSIPKVSSFARVIKSGKPMHPKTSPSAFLLLSKWLVQAKIQNASSFCGELLFDRVVLTGFC